MQSTEQITEEELQAVFQKWLRLGKEGEVIYPTKAPGEEVLITLWYLDRLTTHFDSHPPCVARGNTFYSVFCHFGEFSVDQNVRGEWEATCGLKSGLTMYSDLLGCEVTIFLPPTPPEVFYERVCRIWEERGLYVRRL